jgi:hypothetical protein
MRRIIGATTVVALAGLLGGAAIAWGQHGHRGSHEEGHRAAQACATEFEQVVGAGRGFGMAFAADQNGYPGPMHVLELKDRLKLTAEQEATMQHLMHAMFAESKPKSARREVRLVHLLTHLRTRDLLTVEQRRIYHEARWGGR